MIPHPFSLTRLASLASICHTSMPEKVIFEGKALRELVDYRGAHGVRWVMNGVPLSTAAREEASGELRLDYRGYWVGQIPIGDATGGAVRHTGQSVNYTKRDGQTSMEAHGVCSHAVA